MAALPLYDRAMSIPDAKAKRAQHQKLSVSRIRRYCQMSVGSTVLVAWSEEPDDQGNIKNLTKVGGLRGPSRVKYLSRTDKARDGSVPLRRHDQSARPRRANSGLDVYDLWRELRTVYVCM